MEGRGYAIGILQDRLVKRGGREEVKKRLSCKVNLREVKRGGKHKFKY